MTADADKMIEIFGKYGPELLQWLKDRTKALGLTEEERFTFSAGLCLTVGAMIAGIHDREAGGRGNVGSNVRLVKKVYRLAYKENS